MANGRHSPPPRDPPSPRKPSLATRFAKSLGYVFAARDVAKHYFAEHAERVKERSREVVENTAKRAAVGVLALTVMIMIIVLLIRGTAGGLAEAFGGRAWAGDLATAGILLLGGGIGWISFSAVQETPRRKASSSAANERR